MRGVEPLKVKFYRYTLIPNENGCMLWKGPIRSSGYGVIRRWKRKPVSAHRFSYQIHHGPIQEDMLVLHKCDIPNCVAPDHLFLGTQSENMIDMHRKKRHSIPLAEDHHNAKLSNDDVKKIKKLRKDGLTYEALAKLYKVSPGCISHIFNGRSYKSV